MISVRYYLSVNIDHLHMVMTQAIAVVLHRCDRFMEDGMVSIPKYIGLLY